MHTDKLKQLKLLENFKHNIHSRLNEKIGYSDITPFSINTLQLSLTLKCNQTCEHCHTNSGPDQSEEMSREVIDRCLEIIQNHGDIETVDLTGGAPEMHPDFEYIVKTVTEMYKTVVVRTNLTIMAEEKYSHLPEFLSKHNVEIMASLPFYYPCKTDSQRGDGVFAKSVSVIKKLNSLGYGDFLPLHFIYNPQGTDIPDSHCVIESAYRAVLKRDHDIKFTNLYCMNNMPINRFLFVLHKTNSVESYLEKLYNNFNSETVNTLACRNQITIDRDGNIYDCDFNHILGLSSNAVSHIRDFDYDELSERRINLANHCYGCTAGLGSSCSLPIFE